MSKVLCKPRFEFPHFKIPFLEPPISKRGISKQGSRKVLELAPILFKSISMMCRVWEQSIMDMLLKFGIGANSSTFRLPRFEMPRFETGGSKKGILKWGNSKRGLQRTLAFV